MSSLGVYMRRIFGVCSTYSDPSCYYAVLQTDFQKLQIESVYHETPTVYSAETVHTGLAQKVLGIDNTYFSYYSISLIY